MSKNRRMRKRMLMSLENRKRAEMRKRFPKFLSLGFASRSPGTTLRRMKPYAEGDESM